MFFRATRRTAPLLLMLQRAPLLRLMPEARVLISSSAGSDALRLAVTAVAGLGAFDSVAGATEVVQLQPAPGDTVVPGTAGDRLFFAWQATGQVVNPSLFTISGDLPPGMTHAMTPFSSVDSASGIPAAAGSYRVVITAWRNPDFTGDFIDKEFTFEIANPPAPEIQTAPTGGNFPQGTFVKLAATQTGGRTFTWTRDGEALEQENVSLFSATSPRRYRRFTADPGTAWRSGQVFDDSSWTSVSGGVGFDSTSSPVNFVPHLAATGGNVSTVMAGSAALHLRLPFTVSGSHALSYLRLRVQSDDGFVAWINGTEVAEQNKPSSFQWNSAASAIAADTAAVAFREIDLSAFLPLLRAGENLLAVQAMNRTASDGDFLFNCELAAGIDGTNGPALILTGLERAQTGEYRLEVSNPAASVSTGPVPVYIPPKIESQPAAVTVQSGGTALLHVTPSGSEPYVYQWYEGASGDTSRPVAGAEDESMTSPPLFASTSYWVRVSGPGGAADSLAAAVTVLPPAMQTYAQWAAAVFSAEQAADPSVSGELADPDGDGFNNSAEYVLGTVPQQFTPSLLTITATGSLQFTAAAASGQGYAGRSRRYTLERAASLTDGPWLPVQDFTGIAGNGQTVTFSPAPGAGGYYRLRVELLP